MPVPGSQLLTTDEELAALEPAFATAEYIAVDTEFNRTSSYRPQLCLVQLAAGSRDTLLDMLSGADFGSLHELLTVSPALKLFHAAKQDLEALLLNLGWLPNRILDTQIAAGLLGFAPQAGYANLVEAVLGLPLDKSATRTDWSRRPLTEAQLHYARDDVIYLLELYAELRERLAAAGRLDWALEDSAALLDPALYQVQPEAAWQRLGGFARLPPPVQGRARALAAWREARAQQVDRPRQWVLADKALLNIARANPTRQTALAGIADVPPALVRRQGRALLDALAEANSQPTAPAAPRPPAPPSPPAVRALAKRVEERARELGIAPELLATRRELVNLLQGDPAQRVASGWRREVIGAELLAAI